MVENLRQESAMMGAMATLAATHRSPFALSDYLSDEPSEPVGVMALLTEVLQSLNILHSRGLGHSPLTPSSITVTREGCVGIARKGSFDPCQTMAFRSSKYSAPDAFRGNGEAASCEALDSYLLGFMFYELMLGRRLFRVEFADVFSGAELAWLNWHTDRNRRARPLSDVLPSVPGPISRLIAGMMEKDPARRITDIEQLLERIQKATEATVPLKVKRGGRERWGRPKRTCQSLSGTRGSRIKLKGSQEFRNGGGSRSAPRSVEMVRRVLRGLANFLFLPAPCSRHNPRHVAVGSGSGM